MAAFPIGLALLAGFGAAEGVHAQGRLEAQYLVTVGGLPIGKGRWIVEINEDKFSAAATGATAGLLRLFAGGEGASSSQGAMVGGTPVSTGFAASIVTNKSKEEFHVKLVSGEVKEFSAEPPPPVDNARVPLTDAHRRGVNDPMTASLIRVPGKGNVMSPAACPRVVSVFDGRYRYDLQTAYKRTDQINAEKGYNGTVVVCGVNFVPIAGYVPDKPGIKYVTALREIEMWLAPIAGTRVVVPFRVSAPTPVGLGIMQATEFVSIAYPPTASASAKPR